MKGLEHGTAKPLTQKGWKAYLHSNNHGTQCPDMVLMAAHFAHTDELLEGFSRPWHGKHVSDISMLLSFNSLDGNWGGFVMHTQYQYPKTRQVSLT